MCQPPPERRPEWRSPRTPRRWPNLAAAPRPKAQQLRAASSSRRSPSCSSPRWRAASSARPSSSSHSDASRWLAGVCGRARHDLGVIAFAPMLLTSGREWPRGGNWAHGIPPKGSGRGNRAGSPRFCLAGTVPAQGSSSARAELARAMVLWTLCLRPAPSCLGGLYMGVHSRFESRYLFFSALPHGLVTLRNVRQLPALLLDVVHDVVAVAQ